MPTCADYDGPCFVFARGGTLVLEDQKCRESCRSENPKKAVRPIKLSVRNISLRTAATQSQDGAQGAVTLSMGDSGWTARKYYHPFKAFIIIHNFSKFSQGNSNNLHRIIVDDFTDSMTYLLMVRS